MRSVTVSLVHLFQATPLSDPGLIASILLALINIAVMPSWHKEFKPLLHKSYSLLDEGHWNSDDSISFQSLRFLINLVIPKQILNLFTAGLLTIHNVII
jgi:hypothetical protein